MLRHRFFYISFLPSADKWFFPIDLENSYYTHMYVYVNLTMIM